MADYMIDDALVGVEGYAPMTPADLATFRTDSLSGRKFEADDVDDIFYAAAVHYIQTADSTFEYVLKLKRAYRLYGRLSRGQAAGALNCATAEYNRAVAAEGRAAAVQAAFDAIVAEQVAANVVTVADGTYTVVDGDRHTTVAVKSNPKFPGPILSVMVGPDNERDFEAAGVIVNNRLRGWRSARRVVVERAEAALAVLVGGGPEGVEGARMAYALKSGRCALCGRTLTVPASLHRGLGPECAKKV